MRDRTAAHVSDDFHVAVGVRRKTRMRCDSVVVPHADRAPAHALRIVIIGEAEVMACIEPAVIGVAKRGEGANVDHGVKMGHVGPHIQGSAM